MIEKFTEWIKEIGKDAIENKKSQARLNGDESKWKSEIWKSPDKNIDIKSRFQNEGENLKFKVRPSSKTKAGEWLYDLVWRQFDSSGNFLSIELAMEIEMSDMNFKGIKYDFNKLLQSDAKYKIMVFQLKTEKEVNDSFKNMRIASETYNSKNESSFLLCGWATQKNKFYFDNYKS